MQALNLDRHFCGYDIQAVDQNHIEKLMALSHAFNMPKHKIPKEFLGEKTSPHDVDNALDLNDFLTCFIFIGTPCAMIVNSY